MPLSPQAAIQKRNANSDRPVDRNIQHSTSWRPNHANNQGFTVLVPFFCLWAQDVNSSYPATVHNLHEIKVLFESRYGRCKLNIGFNPYVRDWLFNMSYLSLVTLLATGGQKAVVKGPLDARFKPNEDVKQNFKDGPH
jgi:hypothetical protein